MKKINWKLVITLLVVVAVVSITINIYSAGVEVTNAWDYYAMPGATCYADPDGFQYKCKKCLQEYIYEYPGDGNWESKTCADGTKINVCTYFCKGCDFEFFVYVCPHCYENGYPIETHPAFLNEVHDVTRLVDGGGDLPIDFEDYGIIDVNGDGIIDVAVDGDYNLHLHTIICGGCRNGI